MASRDVVVLTNPTSAKKPGSLLFILFKGLPIQMQEFQRITEQQTQVHLRILGGLT